MKKSNSPTFTQRVTLLVVSLVAALAIFAHVARACTFPYDSSIDASCYPGSGISSYADATLNESTPTQVCPPYLYRLSVRVCNTNDSGVVSTTPAKVGDAAISATRGQWLEWGQCASFPTSAAVYGIALTSYTTTLSCSEILK